MLELYVKVCKALEAKGILTPEDYFRCAGFKEVPKEYYL